MNPEARRTLLAALCASLRLNPPLHSTVVGVDQYEQPFSCMWRTSGASREHTPDCSHPHFGQVSEYSLEISAINESWNVFQQCKSRSYLANAFNGRWPHVAWIIGSEPVAGG